MIGGPPYGNGAEGCVSAEGGGIGRGEGAPRSRTFFRKTSLKVMKFSPVFMHYLLNDIET